ncbi:hypothetical protein [Blastococcus colisei]|uniref:hypothetical protein n=1 Tax=Blastococcus colisei TaxID=1564162 RepID=UPI00115466CB|nr:hypothetical protein [Blastococcus colisei]
MVAAAEHLVVAAIGEDEAVAGAEFDVDTEGAELEGALDAEVDETGVGDVGQVDDAGPGGRIGLRAVEADRRR